MDWEPEEPISTLKPGATLRIWKISSLHTLQEWMLLPERLKNADRLLRESPLCNMLKARYASFDTGAGKAFEEGKLSLEDLREYAIAHGEPKQTSGKQELYEAMINMYI